MCRRGRGAAAVDFFHSKLRCGGGAVRSNFNAARQRCGRLCYFSIAVRWRRGSMVFKWWRCGSGRFSTAMDISASKKCEELSNALKSIARRTSPEDVNVTARHLLQCAVHALNVSQ